jgi:hypothetical protein
MSLVRVHYSKQAKPESDCHLELIIGQPITPPTADAIIPDPQ